MKINAVLFKYQVIQKLLKGKQRKQLPTQDDGWGRNNPTCKDQPAGVGWGQGGRTAPSS